MEVFQSRGEIQAVNHSQRKIIRKTAWHRPERRVLIVGESLFGNSLMAAINTKSHDCSWKEVSSLRGWGFIITSPCQRYSRFINTPVSQAKFLLTSCSPLSLFSAFYIFMLSSLPSFCFLSAFSNFILSYSVMPFLFFFLVVSHQIALFYDWKLLFTIPFFLFDKAKKENNHFFHSGYFYLWPFLKHKTQYVKYHQ